MDIRRARQAVDKKDEQLDASRRILEAQEDELFVSGHIPAVLKCAGNQQFCSPQEIVCCILHSGVD